MRFLPIDLIYLIALGVVVGVLAEIYTRYVLTMQRQGRLWFGDRLILRMTLSGLGARLRLRRSAGHVPQPPAS